MINNKLKTQRLNKRQEEILNFIAQSGESSVSAVLAHLKTKGIDKISRITAVRDLGFLVKEGFLVRRGQGRAIKYALSPLYNLNKTIDIENYFALPPDERKVKKCFDFNVFNILVNDIFTAEEKNFLTRLHKQFQENFKKIKSKTIIAKEFERIIIEFSWKSSQIEGNTYSLLDTEVLLKEYKAAKGKTKEETQMILNHKKAFEFILKNKNKFKQLSRAKIEQIHRLLIAGLGIAKNLRSAPVGITGTNYKPLDNIFQIEEAVEKMVDLINKKKDFFEKAFLALLLLSYIQPFEDGNKRTARLTANAILLAYDSIPISYRAVDEAEYKKASIIFYEINNLWYFKQIFLKQYEFAVKNYFN